MNVVLDKLKIRDNFNAAASGYEPAAVLQRHVARGLLERLEVMRLEPVTVLDLGSGTGSSSRELAERYPHANIVQMDIASSMLSVARQVHGARSRDMFFLCSDAEQIPLANDSVDLVFSSLMLQWCQNLQQVFVELERIIRPGGVFIFSTLGPDTLHELRESWAAVDDNTHVNTFVDMQVVGDSLLKAGFVDPVIEVDEAIVTYDKPGELLVDLKRLGATNVIKGRRPGLTGKNRLLKMYKQYETFRQEGRLPATYEVVYGHAWSVGKAISDRSEPRSFTISLDSLRQTLSRFTGKGT